MDLAGLNSSSLSEGGEADVFSHTQFLLRPGLWRDWDICTTTCENVYGSVTINISYLLCIIPLLVPI